MMPMTARQLSFDRSMGAARLPDDDVHGGPHPRPYGLADAGEVDDDGNLLYAPQAVAIQTRSCQ